MNREMSAHEEIAAAREESALGDWQVADDGVSRTRVRDTYNDGLRDPLASARGNLNAYIDTAPSDFEAYFRDRWAQRYALLSGDELVAYRKLQEIARAAQGAQEVMVRTGGALREAIAGLCAVLAPAVKP